MIPRFVSALRRHRAITRVSLATLSLGVALAASLQGAAAGPELTPVVARSILPQVVGSGLATDAVVTIAFERPMDTASVVESLDLRPASAWSASWNADRTELALTPERRWRTDARYVVTVGADALTAAGRAIGSPQSYSFTTETAPVISEFQLHYVEETSGDRARADMEAEALQVSPTAMAADTSGDVSAATSITIGFSAAMSQADVEGAFTIAPSVRGDLSWAGASLVFTPRERLEPGTRYAVSFVGARDERGNPLGGDNSFSFTTRGGAKVVRMAPKDGARNVDPDELTLWFSQPMDRASTRDALRVLAGSGREVAGKASWNEAGTQLRFTFEHPLGAGRTFRVRLSGAARDVDGNSVSGKWTFSTKAPVRAEPEPAAVAAAPAPPPPTGGPNAPSDVIAYALWQINQSRSDYGFTPLRLDGAISQVATAYAWDLLRYNYFSHTGRDGSRVADRLRRAGISFGHSGENLCYHAGIGVRATLDWCHSTFMSEPYPGYFNHIANILNPRFTRVGVGIASAGGQVKIVWNFAG
jgi:uncharacterized protein YkwD/methionine-rich copper-binding protein CopC